MDTNGNFQNFDTAFLTIDYDMTNSSGTVLARAAHVSPDGVQYVWRRPN